MGGPCCIDGKTIGTGKATDNFALIDGGFKMNGGTFYSAEHAYQAQKMRYREDREKIEKIVPRRNETAWDHGMRCWNAGQRGQARKGWHVDKGKLKIQVMYECNKAKLQQCGLMRDELCVSEGVITHRGSGLFWDEWNPVLLTLIREELRQGDKHVIQELRAKMQLPTEATTVTKDALAEDHLLAQAGATEGSTQHVDGHAPSLLVQPQ